MEVVAVKVTASADAGVATLADAGVASLADAGAASPADAGMTSLADSAGSVAGGVTDLTMLVWERTEEVSGYCDGEMNCGDGVLPDVWCQEMPEMCDDLHCHLYYVNYVGCNPDCVDLTVLEGGDDYPVGMLSSEPFCAITDDMTNQEKIEALSGVARDTASPVNRLGGTGARCVDKAREIAGISEESRELYHNGNRNTIARLCFVLLFILYTFPLS